MKAKLTPEENQSWEALFAYYVDEEALSDNEADAATWKDLQEQFPRLQEFDGAEIGSYVPSGCECPKCGENNVDHLLINEDDDTVKCLTCGRTYSLPSGEQEGEQ